MQNVPWRVFKLLKIFPPGSGQVGPEGLFHGRLWGCEGGGVVSQEKEGSLGSELDPFTAWPPAHGGSLCAHSCPAVPVLSHMGFFTSLWAAMREELMTAVLRVSGPGFWHDQVGL